MFLKEVGKLFRLKSVYLQQFTFITDSTVCHMLRALPDLVEVSVVNIPYHVPMDTARWLECAADRRMRYISDGTIELNGCDVLGNPSSSLELTVLSDDDQLAHRALVTALHKRDYRLTSLSCWVPAAAERVCSLFHDSLERVVYSANQSDDPLLLRFLDCPGMRSLAVGCAGVDLLERFFLIRDSNKRLAEMKVDNTTWCLHSADHRRVSCSIEDWDTAAACVATRAECVRHLQCMGFRERETKDALRIASSLTPLFRASSHTLLSAQVEPCFLTCMSAVTDSFPLLRSITVSRAEELFQAGDQFEASLEWLQMQSASLGVSLEFEFLSNTVLHRLSAVPLRITSIRVDDWSSADGEHICQMVANKRSIKKLCVVWETPEAVELLSRIRKAFPDVRCSFD